MTFCLAFGPRRAPQHPELAAWLGKTRLPPGGAGVVAKGRKEGRRSGTIKSRLKTPSPGRWVTTQWGNENHWDHFWRRVTYKKMDR